ncbi:MAG: hypothetical protein HQL46_02335 [Gammaproteobacteria bacterium]|nr:hypothetical protein [Gammaproteobacteria bacterium]
MQNGFIDLRQNNGQIVEESFWPSFTDVMTVIVMIFLIATTVLIVKNWELVNELKQRITHEKKISSALQSTIDEKNRTHAALLESIEAKKQISERLQQSIEELERTNALAEQNQAENITLDERLQHAQSTLALLKLQLSKSHEEISIKTLQILEKDKVLKQKEHKEDVLQSKVITLNQQLAKLNSMLTEKNKSLKDSQSLAQLKEKELGLQLEKTKGWEKRFYDLNVTNNDLKLKLDESTTNVSVLEKARALLAKTEKDLEKKLSESHDKILLLKQQLADKTDQVILIQDKLSASDQKLLVSQRELEIINKANLNKDELLAKMQAEIEKAEKEDNEKELKYAELEAKYNKLIRPARSSVGKYVVEVRYLKTSGNAKLSYRESSQNQYQSLSMKELHKKLNKAKKEYAERLYVKLIIPDDSGLSYNEAWSFMQDILSKYDYYYQGTDKEL